MAQDIRVTLTLDNRQFQRAVKQSKSEISSFESSSTRSLGLIQTALVAIGGTAVIGSIARTGAAFQDLQNSLNVVFGSVEAGADAFDRVQQFAASTQFSVQTLTQAFVQLKGAGVEPTAELLQTFADTASVTTDQMGTFQAALDLVSRSTAGGLGLEDLNRLADRGIPVFQILQERIGRGRLELSEFGKTAEGANTIVRELVAGLQENFGGALESQVGLINFELNQLGDALDKLKVALFDTFSEDAAKGIQGLTGAINKLAENTDELIPVLKSVAGALQTLVGVFVIFRLGTKDALAGFVLFADRLKAFFTGGVLVGIANSFKNLGAAIGIFIAAIRGFTIGGFITALGALAAALGPVLAIIAGLTIVADGLFRIFNNGKGIIGTVKDLFADTSDEIDGMTGAMKRNEQAQKEFEARQKAAAEAAAKAQEEFNAEFGATITLAKEFAKIDYRTELEQLEGRLQTAKDTLFKLRMAFVAANGDIEGYMELVTATKNEIKAAEQALADYNEELADDGLQSYNEFLVQLLENTQEFSNEQKNAQKALEFLNSEMAQNAMTAEEMAYAMERLYSILGMDPPGVQAFEDFTDSLEGLSLTTEEYAEYQRQLNALIQKYPELADEARRAQDELNDALTEDEAMNSFLDNLGRAQKSLSEDLATALLEGKSVMSSFKDFFKSLITQIIADTLRLMVIQPILSSLFGIQFGAGGSVSGMNFGGSFFGKLFGRERGGPVMKDKPYIVGEKGPELFVPRGASGDIVANGAMGGVTNIYNISAVDTQSFRQALAKDPEYLFNLTQSGARRMPR